MGLSLMFHAGDESAFHAVLAAGEEVQAVAERLFDAHADFSLHLIPRDLDLLSEIIAGRRLRPHLHPLTDSADGGLIGVAAEWVDAVANAPARPVEDLAEAWAEAMRDFHSQPTLAATPEMRRAIRDLLSLCQLAYARRLRVLHAWSA